MPVASVLVCGGGIAGADVSFALARRGLEVSFVVPDPVDVGELADALRTADVEVRIGADLLGAVVIDRHVEAELSDGHVENFDAVVVADEQGSPTAWRVIASEDASQADVVAETVRAA